MPLLTLVLVERLINEEHLLDGISESGACFINERVRRIAALEAQPESLEFAKGIVADRFLAAEHLYRDRICGSAEGVEVRIVPLDLAVLRLLEHEDVLLLAVGDNERGMGGEKHLPHHILRCGVGFEGGSERGNVRGAPVGVEVGFWFVEQEECRLVTEEQAESDRVNTVVLAG